MDGYHRPTLGRLGTFREVTRTKVWGSGDFLVYIKWKKTHSKTTS
jgi:hypothetical protein